jgi:hypothetical protein
MDRIPFGLILAVSLPGLTGQSSIHGRRLLDRPVKPGDDSMVVSPYLENAPGSPAEFMETTFIRHNGDAGAR